MAILHYARTTNQCIYQADPQRRRYISISFILNKVKCLAACIISVFSPVLL